jgi:hypothetical protein
VVTTPKGKTALFQEGFASSGKEFRSRQSVGVVLAWRARSRLSILGKYSLSSRPISSFQRRADRRGALGSEHPTLLQLGSPAFSQQSGGVALS